MYLILNILVLSTLFTVLAAWLVLSERLLVNYGECKITVNEAGDEDSFVVQGGRSLLDVLQEAGVEVQNSCGGRGSCGFCKVRVKKGGGDILPTEKPFLSRRDRATGTRLACQVRIRDDMTVQMPDYLEIVRDMVENETFDPDARWRFIVE